MKAADVMVKEVISIKPDAYVREAVRLLLSNRISAVLVVNARQELSGILSEGDLLRRAELGTERLNSWHVADLTASARQILAEEFVKSHSLKVADVMTKDVITAEPDTPLAEIARLFEKNHIKRIPVTRDDRVVGIVSRANILEALGKIYDQSSADGRAGDIAVRDRILAQLNAQPWIRSNSVQVRVKDGMVELYGMVDSAAVRNAVRVAAEIAPGVQGVNDHLTVYAEDLR